MPDQFPFSQHLQDSLLILGIEEDEFCGYLCAYVKPEHFLSEPSRAIFSMIKKFHTTYSCAPKEHFSDILTEYLKNLTEDQKNILILYTHKIYEITPNTQYVLSNLKQFIQHTSIINGIIDGSKHIQRGEYIEAQNVITEAFRAGINLGDEGIDYLKDIYVRAKPDEVLFKTRIDALDETIGGGVRVPELIVWLAGTNVGKCLQVGTKVIMFDGSLKAVEDVKAGEKLMGPDSTPRTVLSTTRGTGNLYKVKQSQAMDYVVNEHHVLALSRSNWDMCKKKISSELNNLSLQEFMQIPKKKQRCLRGYKSKLINFPHKNIPINPYFLGLWLGDGTSSCLDLTNGDPEVENFCIEYSKQLNGELNVKDYEDRNCKRLGIYVKDGTKNPLWQKFLKYGLRKNKHIPTDYLINSEEIRLNLLAGLVDSDGWFSERLHRYSITQKSHELALQIKFLADSLGFKTGISRGDKICVNNGKVGQYSQISITGDIWRIPCKIKRKQCKSFKRKDLLSSRIKIEPIGEGEYAGFVLDGDHLFLLEDGTVTHNSWSLAYCAKEALAQGKKVLYYTLEMTPEWTATRIDMGFGAFSIKGGSYRMPHTGNIVHAPSVYTVDRRELLSFIEGLGGQLFIKGTPKGGLTISKIEADLERLEATKDFIPELLIIDYADLMGFETGYSDLRHNLAALYTKLRELAVLRNITVITASQSNRSSYDARIVSLKHFAEDIQKAMIADLVISLCQTVPERNQSKMRLFVCKNRNGPKGVQIENYYSYEIGQFSLASQIYVEEGREDEEEE